MASAEHEPRVSENGKFLHFVTPNRQPVDTTGISALEVLNDMRYINPRFTYLLTYLLTQRHWTSMCYGLQRTNHLGHSLKLFVHQSRIDARKYSNRVIQSSNSLQATPDNFFSFYLDFKDSYNELISVDLK